MYLYLYLYLFIEKTVILNTNTFYFKKLSLYEVYFWQVKVLHDVLMFYKFSKLLYIKNSLNWISLKKLKTQTQT